MANEPSIISTIDIYRLIENRRKNKLTMFISTTVLKFNSKHEIHREKPLLSSRQLVISATVSAGQLPVSEKPAQQKAAGTHKSIPFIIL